MSQEQKAFALNFSNTKKVVTIELLSEDGVIQLAGLFEKLLTDYGIEYLVTEKQLTDEDKIEQDKAKPKKPKGN